MAGRWKAVVEYDGRPFVGWQRQENGMAVQQVLEEALTRLCGAEPQTVQAAGRTDTGVHALGQVVHFDLPRPFRPDNVRDGVNSYLRPWPVAVLQAEEVPESFHARFSATGRRYLYRIINRRAPLAVEAGRAWHIPRPLDVPAMQTAAALLLGRHDFTSFRASQCQAASPVRTLDRLDIHADGPDLHITVAARSFLHHQVRNMVGTLAQVGLGRWPPARVRTTLDARDRTQAGPTAPADGLYLVDVEYGGAAG